MGDAHEFVVAHRVERIAVIPQLDEHVVATARSDHLLHHPFRGGRAVAMHRASDRTAHRTREHPPAVTGELRQSIDAKDRLVLAPGELAVTDRRRQMPVPAGVAGQDDDVTLVAFQLCAEHRGHGERTGRLRETHDAIQPVAIGEGECGQRQSRRLLDELFGMRCTLQEGKV